MLAGLAAAGSVAIVTPARAVGDGLPVSGTAQVGSVLQSPEACAGPDQWLRDGDPIGRATDSARVVSAEDLGHRLSIRETCALGGEVHTSAETSVVISAAPELPVIQNLLQPPAGMTALGDRDVQAGVVGDPTDPGIDLYVGQLAGDQTTLVDPGALQVSAVLQAKGQRVSPFGATPAANAVTVTTQGAVRHVSFAPVQRGNVSVVFTVTGTSGKTATYTLNYYASAPTTPTSRVLQLSSDASTAISAGGGYLFVANDEDHAIRLHRADASGLPVAVFDPGTNPYAPPNTTVEDDYEASAQVGDSVFWLGSQDNSKKGEIQPARQVVYETRLARSGADATLTPVGAYGGLRRDLIAWDQAHGNRYGFAAGAAAGQLPDGPAQFNIEGAEFAPDDTTLYLGFRSPLVGGVAGGHALIVPVTNLRQLTRGEAATATFGKPIELDLDGQSIREIRRNDAGEYLILTGDGAIQPTHGSPMIPQRLWYWDGEAGTAPEQLTTLVPSDVEECNVPVRGAWEGIGELPASLDPGTQVRLLMDQGYDCIYSPDTTGIPDASELYETNAQKDLPYPVLAKGRTDVVTLTGALGRAVELAGDGAFGQQEAGTVSAPRRITMTNTGGKAVAIGGVALSTADFRLGSDTCADTTLPAGATCSVDVAFAPTREGATSYAELRVASSVAGGVSTYAVSGSTLATFAAAAPRIVGAPHRVGDTLTVSADGWPSAARLSYQWLRGGEPVAGASTSSHTAAAADVGRAISVRVTGTAPGYVPRTLTSGAVTVVKAAATVATKVSVTAAKGRRLRLTLALTGTSVKPTAKVRLKVAGVSRAYAVVVANGQATVALGRTARKLDGKKVRVTVAVPTTTVGTPTTVYTAMRTTKTVKVRIRT